MKKMMVTVFFICACILCDAQNVGIGTTTPGFPLNFASTTGDKISLYGNNGSHYGFGIQGGLLQIHSDAAAANIAFGYGRSGAFTERARIINQGEYGMTLRGRLQLQTGTNSAGHWLTNMANTVNAAFIGMASDNQVGFFGGTGAQWGLTMNTTSGNVGIGNNAPNVPLAFAPALGKKITLYPGATGDVGFGVAGNRLQIYSDNPNADVAIGYDAAGVFNERFAFKPNGAMAVNGNTGNGGQVLQSNGSGSAVGWASSTNSLFNNMYQFGVDNSFTLSGNWTTNYDIPGMNHDITLTQTSKLMISFHVSGLSDAVLGETIMLFKLFLDNEQDVNLGSYLQYKRISVLPGKLFDEDTGIKMITLGPGTHNFRLTVLHYGPQVTYYPQNSNGIRMMIVVVPQ